ncbi:VWA domain-containing protein [Histidinibacterium aquaticum]|uniref:VWA domain-containing protein n=1 Tax=Histidinibacterium aquaticum TaxID=2613962 RepID=A0A5J5GL30_9RHOB|nr:VWA domain-containing protein [Histidinibacterium aquaticum]KAA9008981.1 VWA domain-containing protein [Histidinibacterium aquaticum]
MRHIAIICLTLLLLPFGAAAQQSRPNTILVMDGSGSMWGQIDGVNKIVIARDVVSEILSTFPNDQNLGLTVYGHRTRGDCTDIETVVAPDAGTAGRIVEQVNNINPRGRTPMTDAVIAAAEALRFTEEKATVVLVSDGIETCNPDPCAAARALEEAGIDFTAHVIGFDVAGEAEALAQMQCIAEETGGTFATAQNASELTDALAVVVEPEPVVAPGTFVAEMADGTVIADPVLWDISSDSGALAEGEQGNPLERELLEGTYTAEAYWTVGETAQETTFTVAGDAPVTVTLTFEEPLPTASVTHPGSAVAGSMIEVAWDGPDAERDYIAVSVPDDTGYEEYVYTEEGSPAVLRMPSTPGTYEVRYVLSEGRQILAASPIEVTEVTAAVEGPAEAMAGETIQVDWEGPDYPRDYLAVSAPDDDGYVNYVYTEEGAPGALVLPAEPGEYELRYVMSQDRRIIARAPITVSPVKAELSAPETAIAGETITIGWEGPDYAGDYLGVSVPGEENYVNYVYTRDGNPAELLMPTAPGTYELRYYLNQDRRVIATRPIDVTEVGAELTAPDSAPAGETIEVGWSGPDYQGDYLAVSIPGEDGSVNYTYTRDGNPAEIEMPVEPGTYELRYIVNQDRTVLASRPIEVTELSISVEAPPEATVGATIPVGWTGPAYQNDFIAVAVPGENRSVNYTYTRDGNPAELEMPVEPGTYEVRYVLGQGNEIAATSEITVSAAEVAVSGPASAVAGDTIEVEWTGPAYRNDFVAVAVPGENRSVNYTYTRDGNPAQLEMPVEAGEYELRYVFGQGNRVAVSQPITIETAKATLEVQDSAVAGETIQVGWEGPSYRNDFIAVAEPGENRSVNYTYTRDGNPAELEMPVDAGDYEVRYVLGQGNTVIQREPITIVAAEAQLVAPQSGPAGGTLPVGWDGPGYRDDFIAIAEVGADRSIDYVYTREGNPVMLELPETPGTYELRYALGQGNKVIFTLPVTVE